MKYVTKDIGDNLELSVMFSWLSTPSCEREEVWNEEPRETGPWRAGMQEGVGRDDVGFLVQC